MPNEVGYALGVAKSEYEGLAIVRTDVRTIREGCNATIRESISSQLRRQADGAQVACEGENHFGGLEQVLCNDEATR